MSSATLTAAHPKDRVDEWIRSVVKDRTFVDIGGIGCDSCNERITFAHSCGARSVTMADFKSLDHQEWSIFRQLCADRGVHGVQECGNVDVCDIQMVNRIGSYDVVHSTGIFYHLPSPIQAMESLAAVTRRYLIVNTVTVPEVIRSRSGELRFPGSVALFLPGISTQERDILRDYYQQKFGWLIDNMVPHLHGDTTANHGPWMVDGKLSYWPYWWLLSPSAFRAMVEVLGFRVLDQYTWESHATFVLAERIDTAAC